jgi:hypothetical protein
MEGRGPATQSIENISPAQRGDIKPAGHGVSQRHRTIPPVRHLSNIKLTLFSISWFLILPKKTAKMYLVKVGKCQRLCHSL